MYPSIININKYHNMSLLTPAVKWAGYCWPGHTTSAGPMLCKTLWPEVFRVELFQKENKASFSNENSYRL